MAYQKKIRVGLIGLNAPYAGTPTGTNWAASAHLPYLKLSDKYEIVALQNSSTERAKAAIKAYDLNETKVRAYGTPEDIANDPNVDLVVSSIRVDRHAGSLIPSIKAGKDVYVEWPIEANYDKAKELADLVKQYRVRNLVGLQGSWAPVVRKAKALIDKGEIGNVENSSFNAKFRGGATMPSFIDYFTDKQVGGNGFTIAFGHSMEFIMAVLGHPIASSQHSRLLNLHPQTTIVAPGTNAPLRTVPNTVPTSIHFSALLPASGPPASESPKNDSSPPLTYTLSTSPSPPLNAPNPPAPGRHFPSLDWRIQGSRGEIRITAPESWSLNAGAQGVKLEVWNVNDGEAAGKVRNVDFDDLDVEWAKDVLPTPARNIARLYEAFAADVRGESKEGKGQWYPDFEYALGTHELIEGMYKQSGF